MMRSRNPWITALVIAGACALTYLHPALARWRPMRGVALRQTFADPFRGRPRRALVLRIEPTTPALDAPVPRLRARPTPRPALPVGPPVRPEGSTSYALVPPPAVRKATVDVPAGVLDAPEGSLRHFAQALERAQRGEGIARITHFGDSPVTGDLITGEARAYLHRLYGDAGHGFLLPGRPWEWYGHLGVNVEGKGWRIRSPILGQTEPLSGLAAVRFTAKGAATVRVDCAKWVKSSSLEIYYLSDPEGGSLAVEVDEQPLGELQTRAPQATIGVKRFVMAEDASHNIGLRTRGDGPVTLLGLVLERQTPGVVYDALGANGAAIFHLAALDGQHWMDALRLRRPDLVVLAYGTNEAGYYEYPGSAYLKAYRLVVQRIRAALPEASVLIMGPMDRAARQEDGTLATMPSLLRIVAAQHKAARELGCAFFDTFAAMGGEGGALRWYESSPRLMTSDFMHPTRPGAERLARMLVQSLRADLEARTTPEDERGESPAPRADARPAHLHERRAAHDAGAEHDQR